MSDRIFANVEDVLNKDIKGNTSTAAEYHATAAPATNNAATRQIEAGKESYLVHLDSLEDGVYPLISVYDAMIEVSPVGFIGLVVPRGTVYVSPDTVLVWR